MKVIVYTGIDIVDRIRYVILDFGVYAVVDKVGLIEVPNMRNNKSSFVKSIEEIFHN
ncbi:MAG: hypothetical protein PHD91_07790 [bacterium]|nr:hypothetical protein [bacterium]MDD3805007.1 hypothetical protein [bacterium]MDD4153601.1 hypothetical protein [bacterium]MDD4557675.1 hypothetical protein [bacterium]